MKAIHNRLFLKGFLLEVVINHKTTKFESNSQLRFICSGVKLSCYQSQNHKIWKQFTTGVVSALWCSGLLSITKLQNFKAIHNFRQRRSLIAYRCYQSQHYKIWKQFTTCCMLRCVLILLLSITKLQNLKAIHNALWKPANVLHVVINHKTTKFESNSQLVLLSAAISKGCYQSQNYKIWKQLTTDKSSSIWAYKLLSIKKLQNMKAIHNVWF